MIDKTICFKIFFKKKPTLGSGFGALTVFFCDFLFYLFLLNL